MKRCFLYDSPLGEILLESDGKGLTGLRFSDCGYSVSDGNAQERSVFEKTLRWLDLYFRGEEPDFTPAIHLSGTGFQQEIWRILMEIPYGETKSYGEIAKEIAQERGIGKMSAQAVGGAVGRNPIALIVPCHRVIASDGGLSGYSGGTERKRKLLSLERSSMIRKSSPNGRSSIG